MSRDGSGAWMTGGFESNSTTPSSEYQRQLRAQCIHQHDRQRHYGGAPVQAPQSIPVRSSTFRSEEPGSRDRWIQSPGRPLAEYSRSGLCRSNSSLELDRGLGLDPNSSSGGVLCRDYGSVNSLDKVDCFSTILRNYRQSIDELEKNGGTGKLSDRSRERYGSHSGAPSFADASPKVSTAADSCSVFNGFLQPTDDLGSLVSSAGSSSKSKSQKSKDRKARSESGSSGGSIFRKLRGVKSDPYAAAEPRTKVQSDSSSSGAAESNTKLEDRTRRKAFFHYDCQSIGVNLTDVVRRRTGSGSSEACLLKRTNTTTGASAASGLRGGATVDLVGPSSVEDPVDVGDGKDNDLVQSCSYFRNETGGEEERTVAYTPRTAGKHHSGQRNLKDLVRSAACNGVAVLDFSPGSDGRPEPPLLLYNNFILEYIDQGAFYYRRFFYGYEHQNFFGVDDNLGPVAVSLRREKIPDSGTATGKSDSTAGWLYQYRIIVRTSELTTLRGSILEDCIPSTSKLSSARGLSAKDVLDYVVPGLSISCLHHATVGEKTNDQLLRLDEQTSIKAYKIGVMFCRSGQATEEEMYNNEFASPEFDEFLDLIGSRVQLKGFERYRGGLDVKTDSTGLWSLYTTLGEYEIMFHVSTLLPFTPNNRQQLLRKRHVGNDIVTIIFQEPGALPFTPKSIRSQFQHVFVVVRAHPTASGSTEYSIAVSRSKNVPPFGPTFATDARFEMSSAFRDFLLVKAINAENAVHQSDKFLAMATRTRQEYLKDLAQNYVSPTLVDSGSRLGKFSLGSGRKKDRSRLRSVPEIGSVSSVMWQVTVEDFGLDVRFDCFLAIATEMIVIIDDDSREVVFAVPSKSVIGWTVLQSNGLQVYYSHGEYIVLYTSRLADCDEIREIVSRLEVVTTGCKTVEVSVSRGNTGQLGFNINHDAVVIDVEPRSAADTVGLKPLSRLVRVCGCDAIAMTHDQMIDVLRSSTNVVLTLVPHHSDGRATRLPNAAVGYSLSVPLPSKLHASSDVSRQTIKELPDWTWNSPDMQRSHSDFQHLRRNVISEVAEADAFQNGRQLTYYPAYKVEASKSLFQSGSVKSSASGSSRPATENFNHSVHLPPAAAVHTDPSTASSGRFLDRDVEMRYSADWSAGGDSEAAARDERMSSHRSNDLSQFTRGPAIDTPRGDFAVGARQCSLLAMPFDDTARHGTPHQHRSHHDISRLDVVPNTNSPGSLRSASPRLRSATIHQTSPVKPPVSSSSSSSSSTFQKDLSRLLDPDISDYDLHRTLSEKQVRRPGRGRESDSVQQKSSNTNLTNISSSSSSAQPQDHRSSPRTTIDIPGTMYRLRADPSAVSRTQTSNLPPIVLPDASSGNIDWNNLVNVASRALEGESSTGDGLGSLTMTSRSVDLSTLNAAGQPTHSLPPHQPSHHENSGVGSMDDVRQSLELRVAKLEERLIQENRERELLEKEVFSLRQENARLQEESEVAASHLRRFSGWFFNTIDKR